MYSRSIGVFEGHGWASMRVENGEGNDVATLLATAKQFQEILKPDPTTMGRKEGRDDILRLMR